MDYSNCTDLVEEPPLFYHQKPPHPYEDCAPDILHSEAQEFLNFKWWLTGVISLSVTALGLSGNLVASIVLVQEKMRNAFNQLLMILASFDSFFLIFKAVESFNSLSTGYTTQETAECTLEAQPGDESNMHQHQQDQEHEEQAPNFEQIYHEWILPWSNVLSQVFMTASIFMLVALTWERHFAICSPHQYRIHIRTTSKWRHLARYFVPVTVFSFVFNIPAFFNMEKSRLLEDQLYLKLNLFYRLLHPLTTTGLAPLIILIVLNIRICIGMKRLKQSQRRRMASRHSLSSHVNKGSMHYRNINEVNMTKIAILIVVTFVLLNMLRLILGFFEMSQMFTIIKCVSGNVKPMQSLAHYKADEIARFLMVLNCSVNFLIYCCFSKSFQAGFKELFGLKRLECCCCQNSNDNEEDPNLVENILPSQPGPSMENDDEDDPDDSPETMNVTLKSVDSIAVISSSIVQKSPKIQST